MRLTPGTQLGRYEIRSYIGAGGMGEVYLAEDTQLGRPVALKLLLASLVTSREHLRRFVQEARATSALNHPNILTIHEIARHDDTHFIVSEFVEGQTLRKFMRAGSQTFGEILDVATQVCSGLVAAHRAGVVHRDLKPENVIVRPDGYVKILDFGLAKLLEPEPAGGADSSTQTDLNTNPGEVLGTVRYMSPEQLRGTPADQRSDVWSFGVVLYEMLAGRSPFEAETKPDAIGAILEREPPPLVSYAPGCPPALQRIIDQALAKDKERRYQSSDRLLEDLRHFRGQPQNRAWLDKVVAPPTGPESSASTSGRGAKAALGRLSSGTASTVGPLLRGVAGRGRTLLALALVVVATALAASGFLAAAAAFVGACALLLLLRLLPGRRAAAEALPFQTIKLSRLTETGKVVDAVISPDGKYVAYVNEQGGLQSLWVRQVQTTANVQVVRPADITYQGLSFSPDSNFINYVSFENSCKSLWMLHRVPTLGGVPKRVLIEAHTPVTSSPSGDRLAFVRGYPSERLTALMVADADGNGERRLATRRTPDEFGWRGGPSWSPSGESIACPAGTYDVEMELAEVGVRDGAQRPISEQRWPWIGRVAWQADGRGLVMAARDPQTGLSQLWHVSYPGGRARRITTDLNDYNSRSVSISSDSRSLVSVQTEHISSIWVVPVGDGGGQPQQITDGRSDGLHGLAWTPQGRLVYVSKASGKQDIWIMEGDGADASQLTGDEHMNYHPAVSPDGRHIAFVSTRTGEPNIWRMGIDGSDPVRLTAGGNPSWPTWSSDGRWIVYKSLRSGKRTLWKVSSEGGPPEQMTEKFTCLPAVSPDGRLVACEYWDEHLSSRYTLGVFPFHDGSEVRVLDVPPTYANSVHLSGVLRWRHDGRAVSYIDSRSGVSNVWDQPLDNSPPVQVTDFKSGRIFWFDWSPDGRRLVCARGMRISDAVLIAEAE